MCDAHGANGESRWETKNEKDKGGRVNNQVAPKDTSTIYEVRVGANYDLGQLFTYPDKIAVFEMTRK